MLNKCPFCNSKCVVEYTKKQAMLCKTCNKVYKEVLQ